MAGKKGLGKRLKKELSKPEPFKVCWTITMIIWEALLGTITAIINAFR